MTAASAILTQGQIQQLSNFYDATITLDQSKSGVWAPVYNLLYDFLTTTKNSGEVDPQTLLWLRGARFVNADQGLFSTDFRAAERLAQTIVQVAGRAGRGERVGEVLIQTEYPEHPLLQSLIHSGYEGFAAGALEERAAARWPPFSRLALVRASGRNASDAMDFLRLARQTAGDAPTVLLLGPVPANMARRAGRHHAQLLIEHAGRGELHRFLEQWLPQIERLPAARRVRWVLDVDPLDIQ